MIIYFLDFLILRFLSMAIKLPSILLGYYVAIQAQNYDLAFISCMNHAVLAFIQADILTYLGIATLILQKQGTKAAQIHPPLLNPHLPHAVPSRKIWRRPLMVRQPYSAAVPSTGGRLHPLVPEEREAW